MSLFALAIYRRLSAETHLRKNLWTATLVQVTIILASRFAGIISFILPSRALSGKVLPVSGNSLARGHYRTFFISCHDE